MRRIMFSVIVVLIWALASESKSQDAGLERLDTGDDSRGWEAVGRLEIGGRGFCTGALIAPDLVLTAAHCLYDKSTGDRIEISDVEFRAGWRNGRASAYRSVRQAVVHPDYSYGGDGALKVQNDLAILQLHHPIRNTTVIPYEVSSDVVRGDAVGVVSYAHDRAEAPSFQKTCTVLGQQENIYVMSCDVDFGSSGAPVFSLTGGEKRIVSVVSAKADMQGTRVALGMSLEGTVELLQAELGKGLPGQRTTEVKVNRLTASEDRESLSAKFVKSRP